MTNEQKDKRQTAALDRLTMMLQSIATLAVDAQQTIGNPDAVSDLLDLIESDLRHARTEVNTLWDYDGKS